MLNEICISESKGYEGSFMLASLPFQITHINLTNTYLCDTKERGIFFISHSSHITNNYNSSHCKSYTHINFCMDACKSCCFSYLNLYKNQDDILFHLGCVQNDQSNIEYFNIIQNQFLQLKNFGFISMNNNENQIHVTSVTINRSSLTLDVGDTYTLSATVKPTNATNKTVSWSSSNTSVVSVSSNGKVTAKGEGSATITATADGKKDTVTVKVNDDGYIEFEESKVTLDVGDTYRIDYDTNLSGKVSWSSSTTKVATVSSSGRITAKKEGTATITATINGKSDTIRVTVEEEGYLRILDDDYLVVFVGNSYTLDVDTNLDDLTFQSSDTSIATVNSNGTIRVKKVGGVTITVRSGKYQDTIRIYCQELSFFD